MDRKGNGSERCRRAVFSTCRVPWRRPDRPPLSPRRRPPELSGDGPRYVASTSVANGVDLWSAGVGSVVARVVPRCSLPFPGPAARSARDAGIAAGRSRLRRSHFQDRASRRPPGSSTRICGQLARLTELCGSHCSSLANRRGRCGGPSRSPGALKSGLNGSDSCSSELFPAVLPAEQDMREVELPRSGCAAEPGGSASYPQQRVSRACCPQISFPGPTGSSFLLRFQLGQRTSGGSRGRGGTWVWVSRRRGCGCATGSTGCFMRCRCGGCPRRGTGRPRSADGRCRWCRCSMNRTAAGARRVWPRRHRRQGATGNGVGTDMGEARRRDEQRRGAQRCVRIAASGSGGSGAAQVGAGAVDPGRSDGHR
jgi:hypothetical protein